MRRSIKSQIMPGLRSEYISLILYIYVRFAILILIGQFFLFSPIHLLPKIRLLVPFVLLFLVPPLFLRGLGAWLAECWVPAPRAAPRAAESRAWLPVKNLVLGEFPFWFRPWGRSLVKLGLFWGAEEARTRREGGLREK